MRRPEDRKHGYAGPVFHAGRAVLCLLFCLWCLSTPQFGQANEQPTADELAIAAIPQDGCNLVVTEQVSPTYAIVKVAPPTHGWFAGTFTNLPVKTSVTLGLSMTGNTTGKIQADVSKWLGLRPLFSYGDITQYHSYEWFTKDTQGQWHSGDPCKHGEARLAGTGKVPVQTVIPDALAEQFLSADGHYWSPWKELDDVEVLSNVNVFRMHQSFAQSTATVAMRVPFTYTYLQALITRLREAQLPGVFVDEIGTTTGKRKLQIIRLTDPLIPRANQHTLLVTAREHATEPASSWAVQGMLRLLVSPEGQRLRAGRTWLLVPIQDPDGSADAVTARLTEAFYKADTPVQEVIAYTRYFTDYIAAGGQLDVAVSLHNVEANECPNLFCPVMNITTRTQTTAFNEALYTRARAGGYQTSEPSRRWYDGFLSLRLYAWCAKRFGAFDLIYEVNDRYPANRLNLAQLAELGGVLAEQLVVWQESETGTRWHDQTRRRLEQHRQQRQAYFARMKKEPAQRSPHDIINLGY